MVDGFKISYNFLDSRTASESYSVQGCIVTLKWILNSRLDAAYSCTMRTMSIRPCTPAVRCSFISVVFVISATEKFKSITSSVIAINRILKSVILVGETTLTYATIISSAPETFFATVCTTISAINAYRVQSCVITFDGSFRLN